MTAIGADRVAIGTPAEDELPGVLALVADAGLPDEGIAELPDSLLVARVGDKLVGTVGLELFGTAGLLRSLAVAPDFRGGGLGTRLCRALIRRATELGVERLFLLTVDAEPFFARLGFVECERASAPANLAASRQFASGVCSTATCLALDLTQLVDVDALQDRYPGNHCFGCGPANERGLQLKSHRSGDITVARFRPSPEHNAGPEAWLNGGIAATLVDCHSVFAAIADAFEREGRPFASVPLIWYVTGSLSVRYERPVPIDAEVRLEARIRATAGRKTTVECTLSSGDEVCATAEVVAIRVAGGRWRANPAT